MSDLQDEAWVDTLRKAKDEQPLVHTALDAIEPLAELGLNVDDVRSHLQSKREWAEQVLVREGIVGEFQVEYVLVIYSYTVENPYKECGGPIYKLVNAEMHSPTRGEAQRLRVRPRPFLQQLLGSAHPPPPHSSNHCLRPDRLPSSELRHGLLIRQRFASCAHPFAHAEVAD